MPSQKVDLARSTELNNPSRLMELFLLEIRSIPPVCSCDGHSLTATPSTINNALPLKTPPSHRLLSRLNVISFGGKRGLCPVEVPALENLAAASLEWQYPPRTMAEPPYAEAAIILGGALGQPLPPRVETALTPASDRIPVALVQAARQANHCEAILARNSLRDLATR